MNYGVAFRIPCKCLKSQVARNATSCSEYAIIIRLYYMIR